jgi:uncharacterized protein with gpF-like domain
VAELKKKEKTKPYKNLTRTEILSPTYDEIMKATEWLNRNGKTAEQIIIEKLESDIDEAIRKAKEKFGDAIKNLSKR